MDGMTTGPGESAATTGPAGARARLREWLETPRVRNAILAVIVFNAVTLGLSTSGVLSSRFGTLFSVLDTAVLAIFVLEMAAKIWAFGLGFFRRAWNLFDLAIVVISVLPTTGNLSVLRALRVIRVTRILSTIPQMRAVVVALLNALPGMGAVILMLGIVFYVFAVMATLLFGRDFPAWFGTIGESLYSLFQIMTLESWSMGIVRPVMEVHPQAWMLFVPFITITTFSVLNLFVGLIVNTMQAAVVAEEEKEMQSIEALVEARTTELKAEIAALRALLEAREGRET